jgi:hypothetical protein
MIFLFLLPILWTLGFLSQPPQLYEGLFNLSSIHLSIYLSIHLSDHPPGSNGTAFLLNPNNSKYLCGFSFIYKSRRLVRCSSPSYYLAFNACESDFRAGIPLHVGQFLEKEAHLFTTCHFYLQCTEPCVTLNK